MKKIIKNWSYLIFSNISTQIIGFFVMIFLAKKLSPEGYGEFNIILSIVALFSVFANSGMNLVLTREVTLNIKSSKAIFSLIVPIRIFSFLISTIALLIYLHINDFSFSVIYLFSIILILSNNLWDLSQSIAFGHLVTKYTTILNFVFSLVWLISVVVIPDSVFDIELIIIIYAIILLIKGLSYLFVVHKKYIKNYKELINLTRMSIFVMCIPYIWMRSLGAFADQVPILMLDNNSGSEEVGFYSLGARLVVPITIIINTGIVAIFPFLTKLFKEDVNQFKIRIIEGFNFVLVIGTLISVLLVLTSKYWIIFLFGEQYFSSILVFNTMAWFSVLLSFDLLLSAALSSTYKQKTLAIITTIDFLILFPIFYIGAQYGAIGFANAKLIGGGIAVIYHIFVFNKILKLNLNVFQMFLGLLFFILMFVITTYLESLLIQLILIALVIMIYSLFKESPFRQNIYLIKKLITKVK